MQRGPRGCTRGEVRSIQDAPQLGLIGRNDASDVAHARGWRETNPANGLVIDKTAAVVPSYRA